MREIVLDTETTGLDPLAGHRITEIGCVEIYNLLPTGRTYQTYLNPERDVPEGAVAVSGLTFEFLQDKPLFSVVAQPFLDFIGDSPLVIHNATFDINFLNAELNRLRLAPLLLERATDTVRLARAKFPGAPASLDALCRRFGVDLSERVKHGALLDAQLLAQIYLELKGGRQSALVFAGKKTVATEQHKTDRTLRPARPHVATESEIAQHQLLLEQIKNPLWSKLKVL
jgi:DNA polymerase-3 subunit epsilon